MEALKAQRKQKSDKALADELMTELSKKTKAQKKANLRMREIQEELLTLAEKHPDWFGDSKSFSLKDGQLKWVAVSKPVIPEGVDLEVLGEKYPSLVKVSMSVPVTALRTFLNDSIHGQELREAGISIDTEDSFKAVPNV